MELQIRNYQEGDETKILELFKLTFKKEMSKEFWLWRFKNNPYGNLKISLAFDGDLLVGHYAVSPIEFTAKGKVLKVAHSMTTMTHPDYQGRGLFTQLATHLYSNLKKEHYAFVWGYPNGNSYYGFIKNLNWKPISQFSTLRLNSFKGKMSDLRVEVSNKPFTQNESKLFKSSLIGINKDERYFKWRYSENPLNRYNFFRFYKGEELSGVAVTKDYLSEVDVLEFSGTSEHLQALCSKLMLEEKKTAINAWCNLHDEEYLSWLKNGFIPSLPLTYMGFGPLAMSESAELESPLQWRLAMGDSDVY